VVVGPFVLYRLIDSVSATASSCVPVTVLKIGGGRRCLYLRVCRILIKMADRLFSSSWQDPTTERSCTNRARQGLIAEVLIDPRH